ncbi:hypothetical protein CRG98_001125 [Punica granatum]|uniref:Uncharacterized protein n=1 Tax=Punica granatum TaxID=22663 RepID=A0A2I0LCT1_PUNGR|nr:hypothetical protein CRG98_001125 [Punica granatum]
MGSQLREWGRERILQLGALSELRGQKGVRVEGVGGGRRGAVGCEGAGGSVKSSCGVSLR